MIFFLITITTSTFSAAIGLAKGLLYGVTRSIGHGKHLDGLISGRFLIAATASGLILVARAAIFSVFIMVNISFYYFIIGKVISCIVFYLISRVVKQLFAVDRHGENIYNKSRHDWIFYIIPAATIAGPDDHSEPQLVLADHPP